jgi:hypothetical protein
MDLIGDDLLLPVELRVSFSRFNGPLTQRRRNEPTAMLAHVITVIYFTTLKYHTVI